MVFPRKSQEAADGPSRSGAADLVLVFKIHSSTGSDAQVGVFSKSPKFKYVQPPAGVRADVAHLLSERPAAIPTAGHSRAVATLSTRLAADDNCIELVPCRYVTSVQPYLAYDGVLGLTNMDVVLSLASADKQPDIYLQARMADVPFSALKDTQLGNRFLLPVFDGSEYALKIEHPATKSPAIMQAIQNFNRFLT